MEVSGNILVSRGATLKIEPGVIVRFAPGAGNGLIVNGNLEAAGTASEPVYFTSALDDRSGSGAGGEHYPTSLPGSGAHPGDWDGIRIEAAAGSSSKIENAIVRYSRNGLVTAGSGGGRIVRQCAPRQFIGEHAHGAKPNDSDADGLRIKAQGRPDESDAFLRFSA